MPKILVVEDEKDLVKVLKYNLEKDGHRVVAVSDGRDAVAAARKEKPDLVLLDVMLPGLDGFGVLKEVRAFSRVPVLMLTAKKEEVDRVLGLELGADDYVTKPFSTREIVARVKAILRRAASPEPDAGLKAGDIVLDTERFEVFIKGKAASLSSKEFDLLKCLLHARGRALTREQILEQVWGYDRSLEIDTRTVDQHVARLREKLGPESGRLVTVKNVGYRIKGD